jgi:hypothetical protein
MPVIYRVTDAQHTHTHMAALHADRRRRHTLLAQWRDTLRIDLHAKPAMERSRVIGFHVPDTSPVPEGWRYDKNAHILTTDDRTRQGLDASAQLRSIPSGVTGPHAQDRPWPGGMPDFAVMSRSVHGWRIDRIEAGLLGTRLYARWKDPLPEDVRWRIDLHMWEELTPVEWEIETMCWPVTSRRTRSGKQRW